MVRSGSHPNAEGGLLGLAVRHFCSAALSSRDCRLGHITPKSYPLDSATRVTKLFACTKLFVCMYVCMMYGYVCMMYGYACMYVFMHACMYLCMHVCVYV